MSAGVAATSSSTALAGETPLHGRGSECLRDYRHRCLVVDMPRAVELGKSVLGANPLPALDGNVANNTNEAILAEFNIQCSSPMVPIGNDQLRCCMALDLPQPVIHHLDSCLAMLGQDCAGAQQDLVHLILAPTLVDVGGYPVVEFHDHPELPENMEAVQPGALSSVPPALHARTLTARIAPPLSPQSCLSCTSPPPARVRANPSSCSTM